MGAGVLKKRRGLLDGVVIFRRRTDTATYLGRILQKNHRIRLCCQSDSNGGHPEVLADLIERKLVHYVAMDIKSDPRNYPLELAPKDPGEAIMESIKILKRSTIAHEFRTTVVEPYVTLEKIIPMAKAITGDAPFFLQRFRPGKILKPEAVPNDQPNGQSLEEMRILASNFVPTFIR